MQEMIPHEQHMNMYKTIFELVQQWERVPELRFGQLMIDFMSWYGDFSYMSDQDFVLYLNFYIDRIKGER